MMIIEHITADSFGDNCPNNWEEIAAYLNKIMDDTADKLGEDAQDWELHDLSNDLWEKFCAGEIEGCPEPEFDE